MGDISDQPRYHIQVSVESPVPGRIIVKDDFFRDFPEETAAMVHDVREYWQLNVEKYFNKSLSYPAHVSHHRIRDACSIQITFKGGTSNGAIHVDMRPLINDDGYNYTQAVTEGRGPAKNSLYVPELGKSMKVDKDTFASYDNLLAANYGRTTKGTDNMMWKIWVREFNKYVHARMVLFTRQCIKKGLIKVIK